MLLSDVPEIQGRSAAGVSHTSSGPRQSDRDHRRAAGEQLAQRVKPVPRAAGAIHSQAAAIPGTTISATPIFVSNPSPTATPHSTSHLVRPVSSARSANQSAATEQRTSSSSGLLWLTTATITGVVANARPATNPAGRPNRRRVRSYNRPTAATPISA